MDFKSEHLLELTLATSRAAQAYQFAKKLMKFRPTSAGSSRKYHITLKFLDEF